MNVDDLRTRLEAAAAAGAVVCDAATLDAGSASFLAGLLGASPLQLATPSVTGDANSVTVEGTATVLGVASLTVTLQASLNSTGAIALSVRWQMPASWRLTVVPSLQNSGLDAWHWSNAPAVCITSFDHQDATLGVPLARGLNVVGTCPLPSSLAQMAWLVAAGPVRILVTVAAGAVSLTVLDQQLAINIAAPDFDVRVSAPSDFTVSFVDVANGLKDYVTLPAIDATLHFTDLEMVLAPSRRFWSLTASAAAGSSWTVGPLAMSGISLDIRCITPSGTEPLLLTAVLGASGRIGGADADVVVDLDGTVSISASLANLSLADVGKALNASFGLPDLLPDVQIQLVSLTLAPSAGTLACECRATGPWTLPDGAATLETIDVSLSCDLAASDASFHGTLQLHGSGGPVGAGLAIKDFGLCLSLAGLNNWSISGYLTVTCFDTDIGLDASFTDAGGDHTLTLSTTMTPPLEVFGLANIAWLEIADLNMSMETGATSAWSVSGTAQLHVGTTSLTGTLSLSTGTSTALGIALAGDVPLPIPAALQAAPKLTLSDANLTATNASGQWSLTCSTYTVAKDWPASVQSALGTQVVRVTLAVDANGFTLTTSNWPDHVSIPLPSIRRGNAPPVSLGAIDLSLTGLTLRATKAEPLSITVDCAVTLPDELNRVFGSDASGSPVRSPLRTGAPIRFTISAGLSDGQPTCGITLIDPPVNLISATPGRPGWWHCDVGLAGSLDLKPPELSFQATSFSGSVAFDQKLQIPIGWIRDAIKAIAPAGMTFGPLDSLPAQIPLSDIHVYDQATGLNIDALVALMQNLGISPSVCDELRTLLGKVQTAADALPERFLKYLGAGLPEAFSASLEITPTGDVTFSARAGTSDAPEALYCLLPALPSIVGIKFREVSFGPILGGSLCKLTLDADIDVFDLTELAANAVLSPDYPPLKAMHSTFVCDELTAFVIYEPGIPIPLPVFFKALGFDVAGPLGTAAKSSVSFMPSIDYATAFSDLGVLWSFLTDKTATLPDSAPGAIHATVALNETYLELPRFLGAGATPTDGKVLGVKGAPVFTKDLAQTAAQAVYPTVAHVLNGVKFFSVEQLVQSIPVADRCGEISVTFGPIDLAAGWMVTTEAEFVAAKQLSALPPMIQALINGNAEARQALLATVPAPAPTGSPPNAARVFAIVAGTWQIPGVESLSCAFGIAGGGTYGFSTGLWMQAGVLDLVIDVSGSVDAKAGPGQAVDAFDARLSAKVSLAGELLLDGQGQVDPTEVWASGSLTLPRALSPDLTASGSGRLSLSTTSGCQLTGQTSISILGFAASANVTIDHTGFRTSSFGHNLAGWDWSFVVSGTALAGLNDLSILATLSSASGTSVGLASANAVAARLNGTLQEALTTLQKEYKKEGWISGWPVTAAEITIVQELIALTTGASVVVSIAGVALSNVVAWLGPVATAAIWLQNHTVAQLVTISTVTFVASLDVSASSTVTLAVTGTFLGQPFPGPQHTLTIEVPLNAPMGLAADLASKLVPSPYVAV
jgi:hypothetical protein